MARTTRPLGTGEGRTDTLPILGGPIRFSSSHGRRRPARRRHNIFRRNLGKEGDLG